MSLAISINLREAATRTLLRTKGALQRGDVRRVMGRQLANDLRAYFMELDKTRANDLGGRRTHFWSQVRRSVQQPELVGEDGVKIAINHVGFALRLFGSADLPGGVVRPVTAHWLTVPARTEAYGKRAREFNDLHFVFFRQDLAALVQNEQTVLDRRRKDGTRRGTTTGGGIFYWLKREIAYAPDPSALPQGEDLEKVQTNVVKAGAEYLQSVVDRGEGVN